MMEEPEDACADLQAEKLLEQAESLIALAQTGALPKDLEMTPNDLKAFRKEIASLRESTLRVRIARLPREQAMSALHVEKDVLIAKFHKPAYNKILGEATRGELWD